MKTATYRRGGSARLARAAALGPLVLCLPAAASAQWTTSGTNTSTTNNVGIGSAPQNLEGWAKVLVATTGRVKVKADATRAPIQIGDLIVTSDVEGVAMKSEPVQIGGRQLHAPGTIIGKAIEPLEKGTGEILVLLSLQ